MKRSRYEDNSTVPVGFLNTDSAKVLAASTASDAFTANVTLSVTPTSGGVWVAIGETPTATADTDGNHYIELAQDFAVEKGDKIIATGAIQFTPFK